MKIEKIELKCGHIIVSEVPVTFWDTTHHIGEDLVCWECGDEGEWTKIIDVTITKSEDKK